MREDWIPASESQIIAAGDMASDSVRLARDGGDNIDDKEQRSTAREFDVVWIRELFMEIEGVEVVYYMLGDQHLLSEPVKLQEAYPHCDEGKRPFAWGTSSIEPHKPYSCGLPERVEGSQVQANEIANQRFDNVQLVLNKRYFAQKDANVDFRSLMRNVPGSVTLMDNVEAVREDITSDVTGSSYQEQSMINMDFDEIAGTFSNASVGTNRQLNETVGGMKLMSGSANTLTEYQLRIFVETWVEPVVRQLVKMIQTYEETSTIQEITGKPVTSAQLNQNLRTRVNVGFGATDPQQRVGRLMMGLSSIEKVSPQSMQMLDVQEVIKEIFGAVGYKDGERFFANKQAGMVPATVVQQLQKQLQELQKAIDTKQVEAQGRAQVEQVKQQGQAQIEEMKTKARLQETAMKLQADGKTKLITLASQQQIKLNELRAKLGISKQDMMVKAATVQAKKVDSLNKVRELDFKIRTGQEGI